MPPALQAVAGTPLREFAALSMAYAPAVVLLAAVLPGGGQGPALAALGAFAAAATLAGVGLGRSYPHAALGLCNAITLARLALAATLVAPLVAGGGPSWSVFAVAVTALALDGCDGWFARRQGLVSRFGARFDMEVDSALALILALSAALHGGAGAPAILLGLPRYLFAGAALALPWMRRDLPDRFSRKVVCVLQLGALIALQAPILPAGIAGLLVPVAAGALAWSFAGDVGWLWRHRR